ncbi:hypothetical protein [Gordonia liuliyuniae]|uniref:DUF4190 domain-containing protein n=1 Tax=Gordonia liuliyuniae TaxID=2911517 RepID=A0ABS9IQU7_9ACTN|nr:hypothetical protein [Gordonia liuliyuniae]MCF8587932.1 hypothetical protein [Gordonia liuliyuniae]
MIPIPLLAVAVIVSIIGSVLRSRLVDDPRATDRQVLVADGVTAVGVTVLLAVAAIGAWIADPVTGGPYVAAAVLTVVAAAATGSNVVRLVLAAGGIPTRADNHDDPSDDEPDQTPLRGGRIIGVLERASVAACLLMSWPAGLAVILAVKSLARFSELRAPRASEQFILGTFASVMWACGVAGIGWLIAM